MPTELDLSIISNDDLHWLALEIDLHTKSPFIWSKLMPPEMISSRPKMPTPPTLPIHIKGRYRSWRELLHAGRYFYNDLTDAERQVEVTWAKKRVTPKKRRDYNDNVSYLYNNRIFIDGRPVIDWDQVYTKYDASLLSDDTTSTNEPCPICNFIESSHICNDKDDKSSYKKQKTLHTNVQCLLCYEGRQQEVKRVRKNNTLQKLFNIQTYTKSRQLHDNYTTIIQYDIKPYFIREFGELVANQLMMGESSILRMKVVRLPIYLRYTQFSNITKHIKGAECEIESLYTHPNVISNNMSECDVTVIIFPLRENQNDESDSNYLVSFNHGYEDAALQQYIREEQVAIESNVRFNTGNSSAGVTQLLDASSNTDKYSRRQTTFCTSTKTGSNMRMSYISDRTNKLATYGIYKDRRGQQLDPTMMKDAARTKPHIHSMLYTDATVFVKGMSCLHGCGIHPKKQHINKLKSLFTRDSDMIQKEGGFAKVLVDKFMCDFTENRNHSATAAHCDSSIEVLSVIDREGCRSQIAHVYFPFDNAVFEPTVNQSISLINFSDTIHVADATRGNDDDGGGGNTSRAIWRNNW